MYKTFNLYNGYLKDCGWNRSVKETASVDKYGEPIPWFTYPCLRFLEARLNKDLSLFEFGSGNSTLWFSKKMGRVFSVEHNLDWYRKLNILLRDSANVNYLYKDIFNGDYQNEILEHNIVFDIVVIDGRDRVNCCIKAIKALKDSGDYLG